MHINIDPNFNIKIIFSSIEKIVFLRKNITLEDERLIFFFSDFYNVLLVKDIKEVPEDSDLVNLKDNEWPDSVIDKVKAKNLWLESKKDVKIVKDKIIVGDMMKFYSKNFLETCSA